MAKNRKPQSSAVRWSAVVKVVLLCGVIGAAGVGYVNQKNAIAMLGERMKSLETQREKLQRDRQVLLRRLTVLQSSAELEAQARRMNLGLAPVTPDRIVHMVMPVMDAGVGPQNKLYAGQSVPLPGWP